MADVEPIEPLMGKIMDRYNKRPEGWKVLTDNKGSVLILGPKTGYRLRLIPLNPQEYTGVGTKIGKTGEIRDAVQGIPSYGFRPLSSNQTKRLFRTIKEKGAARNRVASELLGSRPVPTWQLKQSKPKAVLTGPVINHPQLNTISRRQQELEKKLSTEAYKLFKKRHPGRAEIYR
ncbi:MAG: hypothetical protein ACOC6H_02245 [Thermoproteota archaeon]